MGLFFVSWALWQEMTFVLACAIVVVFLIGLVKLWWASRQVRRQEVIDEEKKARLAEMRKVGLSPTKKQRNSDIPFGVRALQTGVEVDGIWISRPTTPSRSSSKSKMGLSTVLVENVANGKALGGKHSSQHLAPDNDALRPYSGSTLGGGRPTSQRDAQQPLNHEATVAAAASFDAHSNLSTPLPQISEDATFPSTTRTRKTTASTMPRGALNEEALRRLEGTYSPTTGTMTGLRGAPQLNTYIPSSRMSSPSSSINRHNNYPPHHGSNRQQRMSTASADSLTSMSGAGSGGGGLSSRSNRSNHSNHSTSSQSSTSSRHQASAEKLRQQQQQQQHQQQPYQTNGHNTFGPLPSPARLAASYYTAYASPPTSPALPVRFSAPAHSHAATASPLASPSSPTAAANSATVSPPTSPTTTFPGNAFANRATRKVNPAFEVLPAGTFGVSTGQAVSNSNGSSADDEAEIILDGRRRESSSFMAPARNKLRRASLSMQQWA